MFVPNKKRLKMRVAFLGCTKFSEELFLSIIKNGKVEIVVLFSIPEHFKISYSESLVANSNFADMEVHAKRHNIPFHYISSEKGKRIQDHSEFIKTLELDIILVLGWYYMVPESVRGLAKWGHGAFMHHCYQAMPVVLLWYGQ